MNISSQQWPIRVLIVDDHPMLREGTRMLLERTTGVEVVGAVGEGLEGLRQVSAQRPDIVLLDVRLPDVSGIEVARQIHARFPSVKVLVVTGYDERAYARALLQLGIQGYLPKSASGPQLVAALHAVAAGSTVIMGEAARVLAGSAVLSLTAREYDVLQLLVAGYRNTQVAEALSVSLKTVEFHVCNVLEKLGARSRAEAVSIALQQGICQPEQQQRQMPG